jgi:hypothetical protein
MFLIQPFSNLTHLDILEFGSDSWEGQWEVFTRLPKLTHIGVGCRIKRDVVSKLLLFCSRLKLLVVMPRYSPLLRYKDPEPLHKVEDNRLVMVENLDWLDLIHDWEKGANGGVDIWVFSELIVTARNSEYLFYFSLAEFPC